jgi:hypothetical protein
MSTAVTVMSDSAATLVRGRKLDKNESKAQQSQKPNSYRDMS